MRQTGITSSSSPGEVRKRMDFSLIVAFVALGCAIGFLAGLLGIGGAMMMVPFLTILFTHDNFPRDHVVHMAVATAMATIVFTSLSNMRAHHRHRAVLWPVVRGLVPGILLGSLIGPLLVSGMSTALLAGEDLEACLRLHAHRCCRVHDLEGGDELGPLPAECHPQRPSVWMRSAPSRPSK